MLYSRVAWIGSIGTGSNSVISVVRYQTVTPGDAGQLAVLKTTKAAGDRQLQERIQREARLLSTLRHPHVIAYRGQAVGSSHGFFTEFCAEGSLQERIVWYAIQGVPMPEHVIRKVLCQSVLALHYCHTAHGARPAVVHRNLSPKKSEFCIEPLSSSSIWVGGDSVLFDGNDRIVLAGFSRAAFHPTWGQILQGMIEDPTYAAPEMRSGRRYGPLADMYALGCILYQCCTLSTPFLPLVDMEANEARLRLISATYSSELRTVIAALLQLNPATRPSASQLLSMPAAAACFGG